MLILQNQRKEEDDQEKQLIMQMHKQGIQIMAEEMLTHHHKL
jgi:hypothetical protein